MKTAPYLRCALLVLFGLALAHHAHAQAPKLSIVSAGNQSFVLSWPATASGYALESVEKLDAVTAWRGVAERPTLANAELQLVIIIKDSAQFFRLSFGPPPLLADDFEIGGYVLISSTNFSPSVYEDTYTANVSNWRAADATVTANLTSTAPDITVVEGGLSFGDVPVGATIESSDTFTVRHDRSKPLHDAAFVWTTLATALPPTSFELIEKALADGIINAETALVYKVYVEFNDDRLPAVYHGRDDGFFEAIAVKAARDQFTTLSPATQQLIAPFLVPAFEPGSWYELRTQQGVSTSGAILATATISIPKKFGNVTTKNGKVKVFWDDGQHPSDAIRAQEIADEIDKFWLKLTSLLGEPFPSKDDQGNLQPLIIGLAPLARARTIPIGACGNEVPAVIELGPGYYRKATTVVHEVTHAILFRFKLNAGCESGDYWWMHEATAQWAEHYIYPGPPHSEHKAAPSFLSKPEIELERAESPKANAREYGAYLWFFFITRGVDGGAHYVRKTWDAAATHDSLSAINTAIGGLGGLINQWPEFVLYNWNRDSEFGLDIRGGPSKREEPYRYYAEWDNLQQMAKEDVDIKVSLSGKASATYSLAHKIPHLAARYFHYDFRADNSIRSFTFTHPYWGGQESTAKVQAIVKIKDQEWKPAEDWTSLSKKTLCRDKPLEDFEQLVIVISNSKFTDRNHVLTDINSSGGSPTELKISALGCSPWIGSVQFSSTNSLLDEFGSKIDITETATASNVIFDLIDPDNGTYKATSGLVTWNHTGSASFGPLQCSGEASGTFLVSAGDSQMGVTTLSPPFGDDSTLFYSALGEVNFMQVNIDPILYSCSPLGNYPPQAQQRFRRWLMTNAHIPLFPLPASWDKDKIITDSDGNLVMKGDSKQGPDSWHWDFKQVRKAP